MIAIEQAAASLCLSRLAKLWIRPARKGETNHSLARSRGPSCARHHSTSCGLHSRCPTTLNRVARVSTRSN